MTTTTMTLAAMTKRYDELNAKYEGHSPYELTEAEYNELHELMCALCEYELTIDQAA